MPDIGELVALLKADTSNLDKGLDKAEHHTKKTAGEIDKSISSIPWTAIGMAATAGFVMATAAITGAVLAASNLQETTSKFNVVFAGQQEKAEEFVDVLRGGYATSEKEARGFLSSMQDLLVPMGVANDVAADLSFEIVKLSADLGSFNDMPTARVMDDMQSALVGNYETMKKYGVILTAATVEQKIFEMGLAKTKSEITASDKALAAYEIIVGASTAAIGDMARTKEGFANQLKVSSALVEDLVGKIGTGLLPVATDLVGEFNEMVVAILNDEERLESIISIARTATEVFAFMGKAVFKTTGFFVDFLSGTGDVITMMDVETGMLEENNALREKAVERSKELAYAKEAEADSWKLMADKANEAAEEYKKSMEEQAIIATRKRLAAVEDFNEQYAILGKSKFDLEREQIEKQAEVWREAGVNKVQLAQWVTEQLSEISQNENVTSIESLTGQMEAELEIKTALYDELTLKDQVYYQNKMTALEGWYSTEIAKYGGNEKAKQKIFNIYNKKKQVIQKDIDNEALKAEKEHALGLNAIARAGSIEGFGILKAAALPEIYTSTHTGAIAAYKALAGIQIIGPALGAAAAAGVIAYGAQRAATVMGISIAHEGLEFVPKEQPYLLERGERVLSAQQNIDFTDFIEAHSPDRSRDAIDIPPIHIVLELEGEVLKEYIYEITKSGEPIIHERGITDL